MGKIILTERQYRNLNQILIGKEIRNNKGRLNEGYEMGADGFSFTTNADITLSPNNGIIKSGAVVKLDSTNNIICNKCKYENKNGEVSTGSYTYNCSNSSFNIQNSVEKITSYASNTQGGFAALCKKRNSREFNWGGGDFTASIKQPNKYWDKLLNHLTPYGFTVSLDISVGGVNAGPGITNKSKGIYIAKDYNANSGYNIFHSGKNSYKFAEYDNTYRGQSLETTIIVDTKGNRSTLLALVGAATPSTPAGTETPAKPAAGTDNNIVLFQRWYWSEKETEDLAPYVSGDKKDKCKAKYKSALCGGKPCIRTQAVDGKSGTNTTKLMNDPAIKKEFNTWVATKPSELADYSKLETCTSTERGYEKPPKQNLDPVVGGGGTGRGGGGAPFSGQYSDLV